MAAVSPPTRAVRTLAEVDQSAVVDLAGVESSSSARARAAGAFDASMRTAGYAVVVRHGIHPRLVARTFDALRTFFAMPQSTKRSLADDRDGLGYRGDDGPAGSEAFVAHPGHDPRRAANRWPDGVIGFRETLVAYTAGAASLVERLALLGALALGHDEQSVAPALVGAGLTLRADRHGGAGPAARPPDGPATWLTVVGVDGVDGLELVDSAGTWRAVDTPRGSLVVHAGAPFVQLSGGRWSPSCHRVLSASAPRVAVALQLAPDGAGAGARPDVGVVRVA